MRRRADGPPETSGQSFALREAAHRVVAVARTTAATQDFWYAHLVDDVVLLEEVSRDGMHRFALVGRRPRSRRWLSGQPSIPTRGNGDGPPLSGRGGRRGTRRRPTPSSSDWAPPSCAPDAS